MEMIHGWSMPDGFQGIVFHTPIPTQPQSRGRQTINETNEYINHCKKREQCTSLTSLVQMLMNNRGKTKQNTPTLHLMQVRGLANRAYGLPLSPPLSTDLKGNSSNIQIMFLLPSLVPFFFHGYPEDSSKASGDGGF